MAKNTNGEIYQNKSVKIISLEKEIYLRKIISEYIVEYDKYITKVAYSVQRKCPKLEVDDIKQQLILSLLIGMKSFDITQEKTRNTYFSQIVVHSASTIVKKYWQLKNRINVESVSLDAQINSELSENSFYNIIADNDDGYYSPQRYVEEQEAIRKINASLETMPAFERKVFCYYMSGYSVELIAKMTKKSIKSIYNLLNTIKGKIRNNDY